MEYRDALRAALLVKSQSATIPSPPISNRSSLRSWARRRRVATYEIKLDGYRIVARIEKGAVRLYTRNGNDWTAKMPHLARELAAPAVETARFTATLNWPAMSALARLMSCGAPLRSSGRRSSW